MSEEKKVTLDDFFKSENVKPITNTSEIDRNHDHYLFVGANWCKYSQLGTGQFSEACGAKKEDGNKRVCYGLDLAKDGGRDISNDLNLPDFRGVPATVKWDAEKKKYEKIANGMVPTPQLDKIFNSVEKEGL